MTEQEFITEWCAKTGFERSVFDSGERVAVRCYCGGNACKGWKSLVNDPDRLREHMESDGEPGGWVTV
jgi:hypothetical protein